MSCKMKINIFQNTGIEMGGTYCDILIAYFATSKLRSCVINCNYNMSEMNSMSRMLISSMINIF